MSGMTSLSDGHELQRARIVNWQSRVTGHEDSSITQTDQESAQPPPSRLPSGLSAEDEEAVKAVIRKFGCPGQLPKTPFTRHGEMLNHQFAGLPSGALGGSSMAAFSSLPPSLPTFPMPPSDNHNNPNNPTQMIPFQHRDAAQPYPAPILAPSHSMQSPIEGVPNFGGFTPELFELLEEQKRSGDELARAIREIQEMDGDGDISERELLNLMGKPNPNLPADNPKPDMLSSLFSKMLLEELKKKSDSASPSMQASQMPERMPASSAQPAMDHLGNRDSDPKPSSKCICGDEHKIGIPPHRCNISNPEFERPVLNDRKNNILYRLLTWLDFASFDINAKAKQSTSRQELLEAGVMEYSLSIEQSDAAIKGTDQLLAGIVRGLWTVHDIVPAFTNVLLHAVDCCLLVTFVDEQVQAMSRQFCQTFTTTAGSASEFSSIVETLDLDLPDHCRIHDNFHQGLNDCLSQGSRLAKYRKLLSDCEQAWEKRARSFQFVLGIMSSQLFKDPEIFLDIASKIRSNYNVQLDKLLSQGILLDEGQGAKILG